MGDDTAKLLDLVWRHLGRGAVDRKHPARHPTLATIGPDGPEARTLVLRAADRATGTLDLHTDLASPKVAQIHAEPRVAVHVWVPKARLQIRARARAEVSQGDAALFETLPAAARANYGGAVPGGPPGDPDTPGDPARFGVIRLTLHRIDALALTDPHVRVVFEAPDWTGVPVAP